MKSVKYVLILFVFVLSVTSAFSQEDIMVLESPEIGAHKRPLVHFTHAQHADVIECINCHHDYDKFGNNQGSEGQPCSDCHKKSYVDHVEPLVLAFHLQCQGCHQKMAEQGNVTGPVMCGGCHKRQ